MLVPKGQVSSSPLLPQTLAVASIGLDGFARASGRPGARPGGRDSGDWDLFGINADLGVAQNEAGVTQVAMNLNKGPFGGHRLGGDSCPPITFEVAPY